MIKDDSYCRLLVKYPMTSEAFISEMDARIRRAVGREGCDSGAGFGGRDLVWRYSADDWKEAEAAAERVRSIPQVSVDVSVFGRPANERIAPVAYPRK